MGLKFPRLFSTIPSERLHQLHTIATTLVRHTGRRNTSDTAGSFVSFTRAWASCQLRKIAVCTCTGNDGNVYSATAGKRIPACITARASRVMHAVIANYGLALKKVAGKKFRAFLAHAQSAMLIISYEDHAASLYKWERFTIWQYEESFNYVSFPSHVLPMCPKSHMQNPCIRMSSF